MKNILPDGFFGIQILQNSFSAGVLPWIPLEEPTTLPLATIGWREDTPSPFPTSIDLWHQGLSVTGPPTFQMLLPPMVCRWQLEMS